jgi:uncharacterized protein YdeI (YjbR/CyaY-like superfamily)
MDIGETLYVNNREEWRAWLSKHHKTAKEIWLIYYNKQSGKKRIPYDDAVEEALCFGWIDSTVKKLEKDSSVQRFTPRRINSQLSEMNKERVKRLIKAGKMTKAGLESIKHHIEKKSDTSSDIKLKEFSIPKDIIKEIKKDKETWENYLKLPEHYKRIRIAYIDGARKRQEEFKKRLNYFIKMTSKNKKFGMIK